MRAVITVIGNDKPGIIAAVSGALAEKKVNILDISQTIMEGIFTMIMLVDTGEMTVSFKQLRNLLTELGTQIEMSINMQHEDVFQSMHRI
jgi:ACT domain-containing protein